MLTHACVSPPPRPRWFSERSRAASVGKRAPAARPSRVTATERVLGSLPDGDPSTSLNPSCDGKYVALGVSGFADPTRGPTICKINIKSGKLSDVCRLPQSRGYGGQVQWSRTTQALWLSRI